MTKCISKFSLYDLNEKMHSGKLDKNSTIILGTVGRASYKIRLFKYKKFNPEYAQGFVKLTIIENEVHVLIIDTYGMHTEDEEIRRRNDGFILLGYLSKVQE